ncbi:unnamed protein product [Rotaria sp. Silwood1]|nr:unnamed protein product [Rotaria sp. Silwood1]CAF1228543.1 unnamed protein product [Rotaria sp. Silwood1]CAF3485971.1 unnamed protein product [Rotaria sp. Silwood1]CAF3490485.1 unnamed protein product [Rotaria sp. Silwood1]CAF4519894.1 unnamed protein product [Rotaria sp. Silwood1]
MSELTISFTNWLAISLRNDTAIVFNLNDTQQWQYLKPVADDNQSKESTPTTINNKQQQQEKTEDDDDNNINELNRNLIKFTPDGQKLITNGQNKQIYIYILSNNDNTKIYWQLQRIITIKKRASALDLTNEFLLIADKSGDVYKTDLLINQNVVLTSDDCIMGHLSMLLDITFISMNNNQQFILTTDRDEKIRLSHYPNAYNIQGYCLGHTEFVLHVKLIDQNHILSASGDGTLRLWHLPDCIQLNLFETKTFISSFSKHLFYGLSSDSDNNELPLDSSLINYSIWKIDVASCRLIDSNMTDVFIALSIYAYRAHSIYLTTLTNLEKSTNEQCKLTFHSKYGTIIDYCFSSKESISTSQCNLYILFDSNILLKINIISLFSYDKKEILENDTTISTIINTKEFNFINNIGSNEIIFKQLFKMRGKPGDSSYYKRKNERIEQQEEKRRKKQVSTQFQEKVAINENVEGQN